MPLRKDNLSDYWACKEPKCPHCDRSINVSDHELWDLYEEGERSIWCPYCDKEFQVRTSVSYAYSTDNQPECFAVSEGCEHG